MRGEYASGWDRGRLVQFARLIGLIAVMCLLISCQSAVDADDASGEERSMTKEWSLRIRTSGGITGRGQGSIAIASSGLVEVTSTTGELCSRTLEGEARDDLDDAIAAAEPSTWRDAYIDQRGADMFTYMLTLEIDGDATMVEWNDGGEIPSDLRAIWESIRASRDAVECRQGSPGSGGTSSPPGAGTDRRPRSSD